MSERIYHTDTIHQPGPHTCASSEVCHMTELENDEYYVETLDERVNDQLDMLSTASGTWALFANNIPLHIERARRDYAADVTQFSVSRDDRRYSDRNGELYINQIVAHAHRAAVGEIGTGPLEEIYVDNLIKQDAPSKEKIEGVNEALLELIIRKKSGLADGYDFPIKDELVFAFQFEFLARAYMQSINEESPETLQVVFDPTTMNDLPASLRRIATLDINRGPTGSILLNNAAKAASTEMSQSVILAEYIKSNNLPESVKKSLSAMKLGMFAAGAPSCPYNEIGICTHAFEKIPTSLYPEDLRRDMEARESSAAQKRINGLLAFSKRNPVSRILDSTVQFNEPYAPTGAPTAKKRTLVQKLNKTDFTIAERPEVDAPKFSKVKIRFANSDETFETSRSVDEDFEAILYDIAGQKMIKRYLDTYHDTKLDELVMHAIGVMATVPTYVGTDRMITPWVNKKNKAHTNEEGVKERFMRFSGSKSVGVSGGPIGKDTRIIFSQGTENGVRHVTIHKIMHKSDIKSNVVL